MKNETNEEKNIHLLRMFRHSENIESDPEGCSEAVVEDIVCEIKRGNESLTEKVKSIILDHNYDWNVRSSAIETLTAAMAPRNCAVLVEILEKVLADPDDDQSVTHTAIGTYEDLDQESRRKIRPRIAYFSEFCDHRGKIASRLLAAESEQGAE